MQESYSLGSNDPDLPILEFIVPRETFNQKRLRVKQSLSCKTLFIKVEENTNIMPLCNAFIF